MSATLNQLDYSRIYRHWHEPGAESANTAACRSMLSQLLGAGCTGRLVDVGCGTGDVLAAASGLGFSDVVGVDVDEGQVGRAQGRGCNAVLLQAENPLDDPFYTDNRGTFDVATMFDVLEHVPKERQIEFLRRVTGLLKPGGRLVVQVPNCSSPIAAYMRYVDWTHETAFSQFSLDFVLQHAGLTDISVRPAVEARPRSWRSRMLRPVLQGLRALVNAWWRLVLLTQLSRRDAFRLHVTANIVAIARMPGP